MRAVSYTHLDVYKRQPVVFSNDRNIARTKVLKVNKSWSRYDEILFTAIK